jgi:hypothetical protein
VGEGGELAQAGVVIPGGREPGQLGGTKASERTLEDRAGMVKAVQSAQPLEGAVAARSVNVQLTSVGDEPAVGRGGEHSEGICCISRKQDRAGWDDASSSCSSVSIKIGLCWVPLSAGCHHDRGALVSCGARKLDAAP